MSPISSSTAPVSLIASGDLARSWKLVLSRPLGDRGEIGDISGEVAKAIEAEETDLWNVAEGKSGDLASSAPDADCPEVDPLLLLEAGLGRAKAVAPPKANELGGLPFPAALVRLDNGDSFFPASEKVLGR